MLIAKAYAQAVEVTSEMEAMTDVPSPTDAFMWNMGLVLVLVVLFYVLLIMPQQKRFKEHSQMLADLKKGDKVVTGGGLVGKIDKIVDDNELVIDLGSGVKVTAMRSMIHAKNDPLLAKTAANDQKTDSKKKN